MLRRRLPSRGLLCAGDGDEIRNAALTLLPC
jgi:hypothetical protein